MDNGNLILFLVALLVGGLLGWLLNDTFRSDDKPKQTRDPADWWKSDDWHPDQNSSD